MEYPNSSRSALNGVLKHAWLVERGGGFVITHDASLDEEHYLLTTKWYVYVSVGVKRKEIIAIIAIQIAINKMPVEEPGLHSIHLSTQYTHTHTHTHISSIRPPGSYVSLHGAGGKESQ